MKTLALSLAATAVSASAALAAADVRAFDTNGDRFASFDEVAVVYPDLSRNDFRRIDTNRDGRLSSVEFQSGVAQAVINRYAAAEAELLNLASVDTNGDNFVSFFELADGYPGLSAHDWRAIGGRDDSRLNAAEFYSVETRVVLDRSAGVSDDFVALNAVDVDGSRFADFGELSAVYPGLSAIDFDDIDANDDNRVSFGELYASDSRTILDRAQR